MRRRRGLRPGAGSRSVSSAIELSDVDGQLRVREEGHGSTGEDQPAPGIHGGAGVVGGNMQPWAGLVEKQVGPQHVDHLLAPEAPLGL